MTSAVIDALLAGSGAYGNRLSLQQRPARTWQDPAIERFTVSYREPAVGWKMVQRYNERGRRFPVPLTGEDQWLFRTLVYQASRRSDPTTAHAVAFGTRPEFRGDAQVLRALLMVDGATAEDISRHLDISPESIACFEKLFFNVVDRKREALYLRNIVYPDGRLVEMFDAYMRHEPLGNLLLRAGFNNGTEDVLYLAGLGRVDLVKSIAAGENVARKLEAVFMANGYVMARNGGLNQSDARGLMDAKALIAAARQGGQEQDDESTLSAVGDMIHTEIVAVSKATRRQVALKRIEYAEA